MLCYSGAPDFPNWSRMAQLIERHQVTHFGAAPTMIRGFSANEKLATAADLSSIKLMITGGEVIDPEHFAWHTRNFGRGIAPLINFSGGTEVSSTSQFRLEASIAFVRGCLLTSVTQMANQLPTK